MRFDAVSKSSRVLTAIVLTLGVLLCESTSAQRRASPPGRSATEVGGIYDERAGYVGGKWIEILYGRPIKRGRDLFRAPDFMVRLNDGAPLWRAGANVSTRLRTEVPLSIDGVRLEPGEYTVFIRLSHEEWILIVTTWPAQTTYDQHERGALFGAFHYMPNKDVVRTEMRLETLPYSFDQLSWQFLDMSYEGGRLALLWDDKMASVQFKIEPLAGLR